MAGDNIKVENSGWRFNGDMVENFEKHISKSVPLYKEGHELIIKISDYFVKNDSICYEIGSSAGTLLSKISEHHKSKKSNFIGIEIEQDMVDKSNELYRASNLKFVCNDINILELKKTDLLISYYTMQFIHPKFRQELVNKIYNSLNWGGAFMFFEKVRASDARFQDIMTGIYMDYKLEQGYSPDDIVAKSRSIKGILEPFSTQGNIDMMARAGFTDVLSIMKYGPFEGFLAIK
jgi:tRNA (cmo5U34)-methyltransferase